MGTDERDPFELTAAAHAHVEQSLADPERDGPAAVAWCSAHLVAADDVLYAEAHRRLPDDADRLHAARTADRSLQHALGRLDRRLTGDTHLDHVPVEQVVREVRSAMATHARTEDDVLRALCDVLPDVDRGALAGRLEAATLNAPTRPHPHVPHTPLSPLVGRLEAVVDRVRDALDNRVDATGRPARAPRPLGRWGAYLMGAQGPRRER